MLLSMTGYGRETQTIGNKTINIEIRSLNSKYTDIRIKMPQSYREKEAEIKRIVGNEVQRGKIDMLIDVKSAEGEGEYGLNKALFKKYYKELSDLSSDLDFPMGDITTAILRIPNVVASESGELQAEDWKEMQVVLDAALKNFTQFRLTEGEVLELDLRVRAQNILDLLSNVDPHEKERIDKIRSRMEQNLEDFLGKENVDKNRYEQEVIFYLEKIDITEEKVRLAQHCKYFLEELEKENVGKGRKLNFISQEMGREINTLGAKAYSADIQKFVVTMKDELEKIKEQVANAV